MRLFLCLLIAIGMAGCRSKQASQMPPTELVDLKAKDGTRVYAYLSQAKDSKGIILLFHQADSSAEEYAPIIPRLNSYGWTCLAVDLRAGGSMYGTNRTVEAIGRNGDYLSAYQDLEAAVEYAAIGKYKQVVAWGSSYSASLAAKLASEHKEVAKVVAFSPGEYIDDKTIVHGWYLKVKVPILAVWSNGDESDVKQIMSGTKATIIGNADYIHGSSTLRPEKDVPNIEALWKQIEEFLNAS